MFVELTTTNNELMLVNSDYVSAVVADVQSTWVNMKNARSWEVKESFEEVKKRLGLRIAPRGETLAI